MNKQDFTIEGSEVLKKAFVEESRLSNSDILFHSYLTSSTLHNKALTSTTRKMLKHFILPDQWYEALEYVKEYFTEEYKVGDWVISSQPHLGAQQITEIDDEGDYNLSVQHNTFASDVIRLATPIEIAATLSKIFKLGEHTAVVTKNKVEIADRGNVSVSDCINWFEKKFVCNDTYAPLGEFTVVENTYTINIGCVKNVPLKDIEVLYKYLKTL